MSVLASDNFNRADGGLGANWTTITGEGAPQISTNRVRSVAVGTDSESRYNAVTWPNDQYSQVAVITAAGGLAGAGAIARAASAANTWYGTYLLGAIGASSQIFVLKCVAGTHTNIVAGFTQASVSGDVLRIEVTGASPGSVSVYLNGVLKSGPTSDSSISTGSAGVMVFSDSATTANSELDNWEGGDFGGGGGGPVVPVFMNQYRQRAA